MSAMDIPLPGETPPSVHCSPTTSLRASPTPSTSSNLRDRFENNNNNDANNNNNNKVNAPKYGTLVPNRIFVGGLDTSTTDGDLLDAFSAFGEIKTAKVIVDRAGVSKGYGFVTFSSEEAACALMINSGDIYVRNRKLTVAPAIKKQPFYGSGRCETASSSQATYQAAANSYMEGSNLYPLHAPLVGDMFNVPQFEPPVGQVMYPPPIYLPPLYQTPYSMQTPQQALTGFPLLYGNGVQATAAVYSPPPPQSPPYTAMVQPTSTWIDPGMATQYPVPPSLPYLVPMY